VYSNPPIPTTRELKRSKVQILSPRPPKNRSSSSEVYIHHPIPGILAMLGENQKLAALICIAMGKILDD
jgi:hypothetical protein